MSQKIYELIDKYLQKFPDEVGRLSQVLELKDSGLDLTSRKTIPQGHFAATAIIFNQEMTKILLIFHKAMQVYAGPGGHIDATDFGSPYVAALREAAEETGMEDLEPIFGRVPIDIDIHPISANPAKDEGDHWHFDIRFAFVADQNDKIINEDAGIESVGWYDLDSPEATSYHDLITKVKSLKG